MMTRIIIAAIASTALIGAASAQSTTEPSTSAPPAMSQSGSSSVSSAGEMWRSSKLIGVNVYNEANEKLGSINEMILDKEGKITNVVIGVGGFLGMGEHSISVAFNDLKWVNEPVRTTTTSDASPSGTGGGMMAPARPNASGTVGSTATTTTGAKAKNWYPDHAVLSNATKEQLKEMPAFTY